MHGSTITHAWEPFFFGFAGQSLYGCLHVPATGSYRRTGVVLCQPIGDEYVRAHRACCQLAQRLASNGFPVLRFDYSGCGDSAGDEDQASMQQWTDDVVTAGREVMSRFQSPRLCLIGIRLGAALALRAASEFSDVTLVLCDAVADGEEYLRSLADRHARKLSGLSCFSPSGIDEEPAEYLGFAFSLQLRQEILCVGRNESFSLVGVGRVILFETGDRLEIRGLSKQLLASGVGVTTNAIPDHQFWKGEIERLLVPNRLLGSVVGALAEYCP